MMEYELNGLNVILSVDILLKHLSAFKCSEFNIQQTVYLINYLNVTVNLKLSEFLAKKNQLKKKDESNQIC